MSDWDRERRVRLRPEHLMLIRKLGWGWVEMDGEGPGVDCKRPFGSSGNLQSEVCEALEWEPEEDPEEQQYGYGGYSREQMDAGWTIYRELEGVVGLMASTWSLRPGVWAWRDMDGRYRWVRIEGEG